jgi:hypothetical protein
VLDYGPTTSIQADSLETRAIANGIRLGVK